VPKSRDDAVPEAVLSIRRLRTRQERERTGAFYVEGVGIVAQAVRANATIETCVIAPELLSGEYAWEVVDELDSAGAPIVELSPSAFAGISFKENLQGIGAVVRMRSDRLGSVSLKGSLGWVALSDVGNPGNLGAVLRTCDAVGCAGVLLLGDTADPYHPAAVRASRGAIFSQRLVRTTLGELTRWKRARGCAIIGTSPDAGLEYRDAGYATPLVLLMGSERLGLSAEQQAACDQLVRIPMVGSGDSLNLAVAASVLLYEMFQQHRQRAKGGGPKGLSDAAVR